MNLLGTLLILCLPATCQTCAHTLRWTPQGAVQPFRNGILLDDSEVTISGRQISPVHYSDQDRMTYVYIREIDNPGQIPPSHYSAPIKETQVCQGTVALSAWWEWDADGENYRWTGPTWPEVLAATTLPPNCRLNHWSLWNPQTSRMDALGWLWCDLVAWQGQDTAGNLCWLPSAQSTVSCIATGQSQIYTASRYGP